MSQTLSKIEVSVSRLVREAYEAGRESLRHELLIWLQAQTADSTPTYLAPTIPPMRTTRAPMGTVRPVIISLLKDFPGLTMQDVSRRTSINSNSIRATLSQLGRAGLARRDADGRHYSEPQH